MRKAKKLDEIDNLLIKRVKQYTLDKSFTYLLDDSNNIH